MRALPTLTLATLATLAGTAHADCPTNIRDLPPIGFLANETRAAIGLPGEQLPSLEAELGVAGGMRVESAETSDISGTGALGGRIIARRGGFTGCASADVVDVRDGALSATASAQIPLLFTGLGIGAEIDRQIRLPLATRSEFLRAPISRIAAHLSLSFIDLELAEGENHLRMLVMPIAIENELTSQEATSTSLDRHAQRFDVSMFRFIASDHTGTGDIDIFNFSADTLIGDRADMLPVNGFSRVSPLALTVTRPAWSFELDGGLLAMAGPIDCETTQCYRGFYVGALRHTREQLAFDLRAERSAFIGTDDMPAIEDRLTASTTLASSSTAPTRSATLSGFIAAAQPFTNAEVTRYAGLRLSLAHKLPSDLSATVDGELVSASVNSPDPQARVLASIAWRSTQR